MTVINLPTHQVKMFDAFARAEVLAATERLVTKPRALRWAYAPFVIIGPAFTIWRYGQSLGLSMRTMQRVLQREHDRLGASS